jgi:CDP-glucose 4,6-dehydratase
MNPAFWKKKKVLLTGHTGFKGSWLSLWLQQLGAEVSGYSIDVPTAPSLYESAAVGKGMRSMTGDVRDLASLRAYSEKTAPEIVIHMAAQSLVRRSYVDPVGTYDTNIMGTVNVLEAARHADSVRVVMIVTSDKCYDNRERQSGYREEEPMGGSDPYSSSKGCAELVTAAYRKSFFHDGATIASVRAGNAIGGGDWAEDRLIPDIVAALQDGTAPEVRNPEAIRPWQFVMEPLNGYLTLAERLWADGAAFAAAWNFGPDESDAKDVCYIVEQLSSGWGNSAGWRRDKTEQPDEATYLKLDSSKAKSELSWLPILELSTTLEWIVEWYQGFSKANDARGITLEQIERFQQQARQR